MTIPTSAFVTPLGSSSMIPSRLRASEPASRALSSLAFETPRARRSRNESFQAGGTGTGSFFFRIDVPGIPNPAARP